MAAIFTTTPVDAVDGHVDLDFRACEHWRPLSDGSGLTILLGDDEVGPLVFLSAFPPTDEQMPLTFPHAHASDNWRISVRGTQNMGRTSYEAGQFRLQDGGVPYPSDNAAWGEDGGFGIVMFADRRGFAVRPVKKSVAAKVGPQQIKVGKALGINMMDPCPSARAIASTFGGTERGHLDHGFEHAATWEEFGPGARTAVSLLGDPSHGPAMVYVQADAGAVALPGRTLNTEVFTVVIDGSAEVGGTTLDVGCVRIDESGTSQPAVVAGPDGLSIVSVIADRQVLDSESIVASFLDEAWSTRLATTLRALRSQLTEA